jgi:hypothetical protein
MIYSKSFAIKIPFVVVDTKDQTPSNLKEIVTILEMELRAFLVRARLCTTEIYTPI